MLNENFCVYLDAGHGGIGPDGRYTTAPSKMHSFDANKTQETFHNGCEIYEGVLNRAIVNRVAAKLKELGIACVIVSHPYLDYSLSERVEKANFYHENYKKGIYLSTHCNASPGHNARGFEVYTSMGKTNSDVLAEFLYNETKDLFGNDITYRPDLSDGDHDREARFYVIRKTKMPAILIECLFFDELEDARLLLSERGQDLFAEAQVRAVLKWRGMKVRTGGV